MFNTGQQFHRCFLFFSGHRLLTKMQWSPSNISREVKLQKRTDKILWNVLLQVDFKGWTLDGGNPPRLYQKTCTDEVKTHQFQIKKKSMLLSWLFNIFSNKNHLNQFTFGYSWNSLFWNIKRQRVSTGFPLLLPLFCYCYFWHSLYIWYVKL